VEQGQPERLERGEELRGFAWAGLIAFVGTLLLASAWQAAVASGPAQAAAAGVAWKPGADGADALDDGGETPEGPRPGAVAGLPSGAIPPSAYPTYAHPGAPRAALSVQEEQAIVGRARQELERVTTYDASWMETTAYPMGDIPWNRGACTDVVVRSLREIGIDLQQVVHDDIARDPRVYGGSAPDIHIDHRRVGTMFTFLQRHALVLTNDVRQKDEFRPGDIVFVAWKWTRGSPAEHVAIVSDRVGPRGYPMLIENGGPRPAETDSLGRGKVVGHFRALRKLAIDP